MFKKTKTLRGIKCSLLMSLIRPNQGLLDKLIGT